MKKMTALLLALLLALIAVSAFADGRTAPEVKKVITTTDAVGVETVFKKYAPESDYNKWLKVFNTAVPYQAYSLKWMSIFSTIRNDFDIFPQDTSLWGSVSMFFPQAYYSNCYFGYNERIRKLQWYNAVDWPSYGW